MRAGAVVSAAVLSGLALARPLGAQAHASGVSSPPPPLDHWGSFQDSLARLTVPPALPSPPGRAAGSAAHVQQGLIWLRRLELTCEWADFDSARASFARAERLQPRDPWPLYGRALVLLRAPELAPKPGKLVIWQTFRADSGKDAGEEARRALMRALALDRGFERAAVLLAERALARRSPAELAAARKALEAVDSAGKARVATLTALATVRAAQEPPSDPSGRVHWVSIPAATLERMRDAETAARRALALDSAFAPARLALAVALLRQPGREAEGAHEYFAGVDVAASADAVPYLQDIAVFLDRAAADSLRAGGDAGPRRLLRRFWEVRAALAAVTVPERLATHYRRLAVARSRYGTRSPWQPFLNARPWLGDPGAELDARGMVYLRWGEPDAVASTPAMEGPCPAVPTT